MKILQKGLAMVCAFAITVVFVLSNMAEILSVNAEKVMGIIDNDVGEYQNDVFDLKTTEDDNAQFDPYIYMANNTNSNLKKL